MKHIKNILKVIKGFILVVIALAFFFLLTLINFPIVGDAGYFRDTAYNIDVFGCREFRTLFNKVLIIDGGYEFGQFLDTVSKVLGVNYQSGTLTKVGKFVVWCLTKKHCIDAITKNENMNIKNLNKIIL